MTGAAHSRYRSGSPAGVWTRAAPAPAAGMTCLAALRSATTTTAASFPMAVSIAVSFEALLSIFESTRVPVQITIRRALRFAWAERMAARWLVSALRLPARTSSAPRADVMRSATPGGGIITSSHAVSWDHVGLTADLVRSRAVCWVGYARSHVVRWGCDRASGTTLPWYTTVRACNPRLIEMPFSPGACAARLRPALLFGRRTNHLHRRHRRPRGAAERFDHRQVRRGPRRRVLHGDDR